MAPKTHMNQSKSNLCEKGLKSHILSEPLYKPLIKGVHVEIGFVVGEHMLLGAMT